jgi:hypothetical protein
VQIFQLVNRRTHSRAVVVANSESDARHMRPDGAIWRDGRWVAYDRLAHDLRPVPELPSWPVGPEHAHADLLARTVESRYDVANIIAFQSDLTPRQRGEGPDHWWSDPEE